LGLETASVMNDRRAEFVPFYPVGGCL
jgi:hypothetical protein